MKHLYNDMIVLTADDEEPDCMRCMHCSECSDDYCCGFCGADNGWAEYERHITEKEYWGHSTHQYENEEE